MKEAGESPYHVASKPSPCNGCMHEEKCAERYLACEVYCNYVTSNSYRGERRPNAYLFTIALPAHPVSRQRIHGKTVKQHTVPRQTPEQPKIRAESYRLCAKRGRGVK